MFYSDKPILGKQDDSLNRTVFSRQLAKALLSYTKIDNFTVSLCGKWGSGKTSILNMVIEEIKELSANIPEEERPIVVTFNPWNYSDRTQLLNQFFQTIRLTIGSDNGNERLGAVGKALQKYSSVLDYSSYIPVVGQYLGPIKDLIKGLGEHIEESAEDRSGLAQQKEAVVEALKAQKQKFIIIIDDIDRLNNEQIRLIFQLVNSLAGFPNMIYLLSFDREVVTRALEIEQNCNGDEYLEKIIQVPFEVPMANKSLVDGAFCKRFGDIIFGEDSVDGFEENYWSGVFTNSISPFVKNMRDVNRIINAFEFKYRFMKEETNCIDLLALTTLQVCAPDIYNWIFNNSSRLTGSVYSAGGISTVQQKENHQRYLDEFAEVYGTNPALMLKVLQALFPKLSWLTGGYGRNNDSDAELRRKQKIASGDKILRYFNLSLEDIVIDKKQILQSTREYDKEQLEDYFASLMKSECLSDYLHELIAFVPEIPHERRLLFVEQLIRLQTLEENRKKKGLLIPTPATKAAACVLEILKAGSQIENFVIIKSLIEQATPETIPYICEIVEYFERGYGRLGKSIDYSFMFVEEASIDEIEQLLLNKIKELSAIHCLFDFEGVEEVVMIWRFLEKETLNAYILNLVKDAVNVPKYLNQISTYWYSSSADGWGFREESFDEVISKEEAYKKIVGLKKTEGFSGLAHKFKRSTVAFYLWYNREGEDRMKITKDEVDALIPTWEYSISEAQAAPQ